MKCEDRRLGQGYKWNGRKMSKSSIWSLELRGGINLVLELNKIEKTSRKLQNVIQFSPFINLSLLTLLKWLMWHVKCLGDTHISVHVTSTLHGRIFRDQINNFKKQIDTPFSLPLSSFFSRWPPPLSLLPPLPLLLLLPRFIPKSLLLIFLFYSDNNEVDESYWSIKRSWDAWFGAFWVKHNITYLNTWKLSCHILQWNKLDNYVSSECERFSSLEYLICAFPFILKWWKGYDVHVLVLYLCINWSFMKKKKEV